MHYCVMYKDFSGHLAADLRCNHQQRPLRNAGMSKVLVAVKRVIDYNARVRIKPDKARFLHRSLAQHRGALGRDTC